MKRIIASFGCNNIRFKTVAGLCGRAKNLGLMALSLCLFWCCCQSTQAQANDGLWKTYMEAAAKAQESKAYDDAEKLYKLAEVKAKEFGETDERYVKTLIQLIKLYMTQKKRAEVGVPYKQLLVSLEKGVSAGSLTNANEVYELGLVFSSEKMHQEAEPLYKQTVAIHKRGMKPGDKKLGEYLHRLGSSYYLQNKLVEAEKTFKEDLEILESDADLSKQMITAYTLGTLSLITSNLKRYEESEKYIKRAVEVAENLRGKNHPETASMLKALFFVLAAQEKYIEAEAVMKRAIQIDEDIYGKTSAPVEFDIDALATLYIRQARYDEAATLESRALDILDSLPNPQAVDVSNVTNRLFTIYINQRNYVQGEAVCKRAQSIFEKKSLNNAGAYSFITNCLASIYFRAGNYVAEAEAIKKFIESQEGSGAEEETPFADQLIGLGNSYIRQKKYDDAIAVYRRAEKIYGKTPAKTNIGLLYSFARYYYYTGNYAESESYFAKMLALAESDKDAPDAMIMAWYKKGYALVLYAQGKTAQAEEIFKTSTATLKTDKLDGERDVSTSYYELAILFTTQGKYAEAEPLFKQAIELREKALGANHPELAASLEGYAGLLKKTGRAGEAASMESRAQAIRAKQPSP